MEKPYHFFSESGPWKITAEFIAPNGNTMLSEGESIISIGSDGEIINRVRVASKEINRREIYRIVPVSPVDMVCESLTPAPGRLTGRLNIEGNMLFLRYRVEGGAKRGYMMIHRKDAVCYTHGTVFEGDTLLKDWSATLNKIA
jgi:hypothetical protein